MVDVLYPIVDIFCVIILAFLGFQNENYSNIGRRQIYFRFIIINVVIFCFIDAFWGFIASHTILDISYIYLATTLFYIMSTWVSASWLRYIMGSTEYDQKLKHPKLFYTLVLLPFVFFLIFMIGNNVHHWLFTIENGEYKRQNTNLIFILYVLQYGYFLFAFILSCISGFDKLKGVKVRQGVFYFSLVPIIAGIFQFISPEHPYNAIGYTMGCFILFVFDVLVEREEAEGKTLELKQKQILDKCNEILSKTNAVSVQKNIDTLLSLLCNYYDADRVMLMLFDGDENETISCGYEYFRNGVIGQKDSLQNLESEKFKIWIDRLNYQDGYHVSNVFDYVYDNNYMADYFRKNNIMSAILSPLRFGGMVKGFIAFDNPRTNTDDFSIVRTVSIYINSELLRKKQVENEQKTSGAVLLTLAAEYSSVYYIDLNTGSVKPYRLDSHVRRLYGRYFEEDVTYRAIYEMYLQDSVLPEDIEDLKPFGDTEVLKKKLRNRNTIKRQFRSNSSGNVEYFQAKWVKVGKDDNEPDAVVLGFANISEQVRSKELLLEQKKAIEKQQLALDSAIEKAEDAERISQINRLTGLFNKISGQNLINDYLITKKTTVLYSLIFIDIDKFKDFNDKYGHLVGDEILMLVGEVIKNNCRQNDIAIRFGGDEFVILLKNVHDSEPALRKAKCIQTELKNISGDKEYNLTCSIGIITSTTPNFDDAVQTADEALYDVKENGRNNIKVIEKLVE